LQETADSMSVTTAPSSITDTPICDANMLTGYQRTPASKRVRTS
jgi:hypothetical protein